MKKNVYLTVLTIVTVICVVIGLCYHTINFGVSFMDGLNIPFFSLSRNTTSGNGSKSSEMLKDPEDIMLDEFNTIKVDADVMDLNIEYGSNFSLSYYCNEKLIPDYKVKDGVLTVTQNSDLTSLWGGNKKCSVTITVPEELEFVDIASDVGDIDLKNLSIKTLTLTADVGDIDIIRCTLGQVTLTADLGDIDVENSSFIELKATNDVGDTDIESSISLSDYEIDLKTDIGEVEVNDRNSHRSFQQPGTGNGKLTVSNSTGDIEVSY